MGLLDDAIREHLELKRKRGGDPDEVARLENEALGPAVRETPPALDAEGTAEPAVAGESPPVAPVPEPAPEQSVAHEEPVPVVPLDVATPPHGDPPAHPTQVFDTEHEFPEDSAPAPPPPAAPVEPPPTQPHPAPPLPEPAAPPPPQPEPQPPAQTAPPAPPADDDDPFAGDEPFAPETPAHDVLEETPEFLQETPEHDRLWFEQKPPRDFDFDG